MGLNCAQSPLWLMNQVLCVLKGTEEGSSLNSFVRPCFRSWLNSRLWVPRPNCKIKDTGCSFEVSEGVPPFSTDSEYWVRS